MAHARSPFPTRLKVLLILMGSAALIWVSVRFFAFRTVGNEFEKLERQQAVTASDGFYRFIGEQLLRIETFAADYGIWDPTYRYARSPNDAFPEENFSARELGGIGIDLALIVDRKERILTFRLRQAGTDHWTTDREILRPYFGTESPLVQMNMSHSTCKGMIPLGGEVLLVASSPILQSDGTGPSAGVIFLGRYLSHQEIESFSRLSGLQVGLIPHPPGKPFLPAEGSWIRGPSVPPPIGLVLKENEMVTLSLWKDLLGRKAFLVRMKAPRVLWAQGRQSVQYLLGWMGAILLLGISILFLVLEKLRSAQEYTQQARERYRTLLETTADWVWEMDRNLVFTYASPQCADILGLSPADLEGRSVFDLLAPAEEEEGKSRLNHLLQSRNVFHYQELLLARPDGLVSHVEFSGRPVLDSGGAHLGFRGVARDVTLLRIQEQHQHRLEEQIRHTQKLESLGVLAGGIAHDFNNLLTGILGNTSLVLSELPENHPSREALEQVRTASQRAADLSNQMLAYSGRGTFVTRPLDLSVLLDELTPLLTHSISKKCSLVRRYAPLLPAVEGDPSQLRQVVMNIVINASESLGDEQGTVTLRTCMQELDATMLEELPLNAPLPPGRYVVLEVSDSGSGMDPETLGRIFDPFFSTKFTGRGLGLSTVEGIVRSHHGTITVDSQPGCGTTFRIFLPASSRIQAEPPALAPPRPFHGSGHILVADDEEALRQLTKRLLERMGFQVHMAVDGEEALRLFQEAPDLFRLVILDLTMPKMDGHETLEAIRSIRGDIPVLLSSGYSQQEAHQRFANFSRWGFLQKPYTADRFAAAIRSILT